MTTPEPAPGARGVDRLPDGARVPDHALRAGMVAGLAYLLVGWRALLVPSLIRFVAPAFDQSDAGMGTYFLGTAAAYGVGSLFGGRAIRALGSRVVLPGALLLMAAALLVQGLTGAWAVFLVAGVLVSVGASAADVGINALVLDLFPASRGRALNLLHVSYSAGALVAPLVIAGLIAASVPWPAVMLGTGVAAALGAIALALTVPGHAVALPEIHDVPPADEPRGRRPLPLFLWVMALSIVGYVASEAGVSDWLVRYLEALPQAEASLALTLFWGGIAAGRLAFARVGNRLEPQGSAAVLAATGAALLLVALALPVSSLSPYLFGTVGLAFGPIFPLVVAAAGARLPGRSATVSGALITAAVVGAVAYPPAIGFLSGIVGLQVAMLGTVVAAAICAVAVLVARRLPA